MQKGKGVRCMPLQRGPAQAIDTKTLATRLGSGDTPKIIVDGVSASLDAVPLTTVRGASSFNGLARHSDGGVMDRG